MTRRVAVIGAGFMGSMHASIFSQAPNCELAAIVDPNTGLAGEVAARSGGAKVYATHDELLASERLDLVSICTPDNLHRAPAEAVAGKGVNLFIEKAASTSQTTRGRRKSTRNIGRPSGIGSVAIFASNCTAFSNGWMEPIIRWRPARRHWLRLN